jgi:hypothetical protein
MGLRVHDSCARYKPTSRSPPMPSCAALEIHPIPAFVAIIFILILTTDFDLNRSAEDLPRRARPGNFSVLNRVRPAPPGTSGNKKAPGGAHETSTPTQKYRNMKACLRTHAVVANARHSTLCLCFAPRPEHESIPFILFRYFCVGPLGVHEDMGKGQPARGNGIRETALGQFAVRKRCRACSANGSAQPSKAQRSLPYSHPDCRVGDFSVPAQMTPAPAGRFAPCCRCASGP